MEKKIDDGVIPGLGITEDIRDRLAKRDWTGPKKVSRVDDPDTWTTAECVNRRYSGFRIYALTREVELWVLGYIRARTKIELIEKNPSLLATMHEEVFLTGGTVIATDAPVEGMGKKGTVAPKGVK